MTLIMLLLDWVHSVVRFVCVILSVTEKKNHSVCIISMLQNKLITLGGGKKKVLPCRTSFLKGDFHQKKKDCRMVL